MKYLLLILLVLMAFHVTYSQLPDDTTAAFDPFAETEEEEQASGVDEAVTEEENASGVGEALEIESEIIEELGAEEALEVIEALEDFVEEEESQPDAAGNVNLSITKFLSTDFHNFVLKFVYQFQLYSLEAYGLIPTYYAWQLDKVNFISFNKQENVYRINIRVHDVEISRDFYTGHSVVEITDSPQRIHIVRSKYGLNNETADVFTDPAILNIINSNWSSIDPADAQQDPAFVDLMNYAVNSTIEFAVPRTLPQGDYSLKSLNAVNIQGKPNGNVYHLYVELNGPNGYTIRGEISVLKRTDGILSYIQYGFEDYLPPSA